MESIRNPFKVLGASEEITMRNPWGKLHTVLDKQDQQTKRRESNTTKQLSEQIWRINTFSAFLRWREWQVPSKVPWGAQWQHDCLHKQSILKKHLQKSWLFLSEVSLCSFSGTPPNMQAHGLHRCCRRAKDWPCDWTLNELGSHIVATSWQCHSMTVSIWYILWGKSSSFLQFMPLAFLRIADAQRFVQDADRTGPISCRAWHCTGFRTKKPYFCPWPCNWCKSHRSIHEHFMNICPHLCCFPLFDEARTGRDPRKYAQTSRGQLTPLETETYADTYSLAFESYRHATHVLCILEQGAFQVITRFTLGWLRKTTSTQWHHIIRVFWYADLSALLVLKYQDRASL